MFAQWTYSRVERGGRCARQHAVVKDWPPHGQLHGCLSAVPRSLAVGRCVDAIGEIVLTAVGPRTEIEIGRQGS